MREKILSVLANDTRIANAVIVAGIALAGVGHILIMYGSYFKGLKTGVELRDDYYYQKEIREYESREN